MKNAVKKVLSIMLVAVMLFGAAPLNGFVDLELFGIRASAVEVTDTTISGTIGTKLSWSIDKATKVLTIDNDGAMVSFASDDAPWRNYKDYFDSVVINEGCTNISQNAFYECDNIVSVDLPDTIETIDDYAFYHCYNLSNEFNYDNITSIGRCSFYECNKITDIIFDCEQLEIGYGAFHSCDNLVSVSFNCNTLTINGSVFYNCDSLSDVSFECSKLYISSGAFYDCDALTSVSINCSVYSGYDYQYNNIGSNAFSGCDNLESVIISAGVDSIGSEAFANCPKLEKVTIYNKNCEIAETAISIYSTIYGFTGSTAEKLANTYGYNFVSIDTPCEHTYSNDCDTSCNICGETRETGAHDYSNWTITKEASCNKTGLTERTCSICGDVDKEIIEMLPHTDEDEDGICEVCEKQFEIKYPMHGVCGENLTWTLSDDGVLTIEGTGAMYDFNESNYISIYTGGYDDERTTEIDLGDPRETTAAQTTREPTTANDFDDPRETTWYYDQTTSVDDGDTTHNNYPIVTHPNGYPNYPTGVYSVRNAAVEEESTTAPSITLPESTTVPTKVEICAYYPTTEVVEWTTELGVHYPAEGYLKIFRWNLHFDKIKKVVIGEGVTSIGDYAFANCPQLTEIDMADSLTYIGYRAFSSCSGLKEIEIPQNVSTIESNAFNNCILLETLNFNAINYNDYYASFYNCNIKTLTVGANVNSFPDLPNLETVTFANGATMVPNYAFNGCTKLTTVTLPDTIITIGEDAFNNCRSLESIDIPDSVTTIKRDAFYNCSSLTSITIPQNVTTLGYSDYYGYGYYAFYNCVNLTEVNFNAYNCSIYYNEFANCPVKTLNIGPGVIKLPKFSSIETVTFADGTTSVPSSAFSECYNLKTVNLPDSVTRIENYAFSNCDSLLNFEIPENVVYIGDNAFYDCDALAEISIPETVNQVEWYAFAYCDNLSVLNFNAKNCSVNSNSFYQCPIKTLNVGAGVNKLPTIRTLETVAFAEGATKVPNNAFLSCTELTTVNLPDSIETIGNNAFYCCYSLESIDMPDRLVSIGRSAFDNCTSLSEITIPDGVEQIGQYAFYGCISVPAITIPENVSEIGYAAFGSCYALETVEFNAIDCDIKSNDIFYGSNAVNSLTIGNKVTKIPYRFMSDKVNVTVVEIPSSVKEIGYRAFGGTSLSTLDLPYGTEVIGDSAFADIATLTVITIPETVASIEPVAFANNTSLEKINFNAVNANDDPENYNYYYGDVFANCGSQTDGIELVFGESVEKIPAFMFEVGSETAHPNIKNVVIGSNVTEIGDSAFRYCGSIKNVEFGEKVETIGEYAFSGCVGLESIELPESIRTISDGAFASCNGLTELTLPNNVRHIGIDAFESCSSVETINYNATNCYVDYNNSEYAFDNCKGIKTVNIGNNVETVPAYAFTGCSNLEKAYIPDIVINIDPHAFFGCGKVAIVCKNGSYANVFAVQNGVKYVLEDNVTGTAFEIRNDMLLGYSGSAQNIVLPSDISSVGLDAFKGNGTVKSIEIPYSVSKIYSGAFANCSKLERVIIPFTITDISASAFTGTNATIYCYYNSYAYNYAIANNIDYELITVTLSTDSVNIVKTQSVTVDAVPSITLASGIPLVWKSNNPAVASVDSTGKIVGNSVGATKVGVYDINGNMLDECSVTVGEEIEVEFEEPSTDTLKYGEKLVLHINTANLPDGASVKWTTSDGNNLKISNENAACDKHSNCVTCTVESVGNGSAEITGTVVDKNGKPIIQDGKEIEVSYKMNSKAGFFQKIIAFFKKLFGLLKTYSQEV